jgi:hypothetical protein
MRNIFLMSILLIAVFACGESTKKPVTPQNGYTYDSEDSLNFVRQTYKEGVVVAEEIFVNGKIDGLAKHYFQDGTLRSTIEYKEAKRHGMMVSYYETGEKHGDIPYVNGKINGTRHNYKKDGSLTMVCSYVDGKPIPPLEEYDVAGQKITQPVIKFSSSGGVLKMELNDRTYTSATFFRIADGKLVEIPAEKGVVRMSGAKKGTEIRAYYKTPRGAEGAVDAKY